jgi:hypothetical protein
MACLALYFGVTQFAPVKVVLVGLWRPTVATISREHRRQTAGDVEEQAA